MRATAVYSTVKKSYSKALDYGFIYLGCGFPLLHKIIFVVVACTHLHKKNGCKSLINKLNLIYFYIFIIKEKIKIKIMY